MGAAIRLRYEDGFFRFSEMENPFFRLFGFVTRAIASGLKEGIFTNKWVQDGFGFSNGRPRGSSGLFGFSFEKLYLSPRM